MGHNVRLIVPTNSEAELGPIIGRILGKWGGVTMSNASGWWIDKNGRLVKDDSSVLECAIGDWDQAAKEWWYDLASVVRVIWAQDCVFLSVSEGRAELCYGHNKIAAIEGPPQIRRIEEESR